jgi:hypothetical protein
MSLVNDIDVGLYAESHEESVLSGVRQFLRVFKCCDGLLEALEKRKADELDEHVRRANTQYSTRLRKKGCKGKVKERPKQPQPERVQTVIGFCPKCGSNLMGVPIPNCETEKSGRVFYKECSACSYYSEIFLRRNKHYEMEGG